MAVWSASSPVAWGPQSPGTVTGLEASGTAAVRREEVAVPGSYGLFSHLVSDSQAPRPGDAHLPPLFVIAAVAAVFVDSAIPRLTQGRPQDRSFPRTILDPPLYLPGPAGVPLPR